MRSETRHNQQLFEKPPRLFAVVTFFGFNTAAVRVGFQYS